MSSILTRAIYSLKILRLRLKPQTEILQRFRIFRSPRNNDGVCKTFCLEPVGGQLRFYLLMWETIITDQWVLSIVREGYKLEFSQIPFMDVRHTVVPQNDVLISKEIAILIEKRCCRKLFLKISKFKVSAVHFVLIPKKKYQVKTSYKSETPQQVSAQETF